MTEITRDELWERLQRGEALVVVDALPPMSYAHSHLPGAINLPPEWVDERGAQRIPRLDSEIVVYCTNAECENSRQVATRLTELGYRNVLHYAGGKQEWKASGLPLEGGGVR